MKSTEKRSPKEADEPHVEMSTTQTVDMEYMKWILILINFSVFACKKYYTAHTHIHIFIYTVFFVNCRSRVWFLVYTLQLLQRN